MGYARQRGRERGVGDHDTDDAGDDITPEDQGATAGGVNAGDDDVQPHTDGEGTRNAAGPSNASTSTGFTPTGFAGDDPFTPTGFTPDSSTFWTDHPSQTPAAPVPGATVPGVAAAPKLTQIREEGPATMPGVGPSPRLLAPSFDTPADQGKLDIEAAVRSAMLRDIVRECVSQTNAYVHTEIERFADQAAIAAAEACEQQSRIQARYA
jgi:hypothetical protein